jgi:hypothetical protein
MTPSFCSSGKPAVHVPFLVEQQMLNMLTGNTTQHKPKQKLWIVDRGLVAEVPNRKLNV